MTISSGYHDKTDVVVVGASLGNPYAYTMNNSFICLYMYLSIVHPAIYHYTKIDAVHE